MATIPKKGATKKGREQRKKSKTAQSRLPALSRFYHYRAPAITPGDFTFILDLLRARQPPMSLGRMVDTLTWDDEQTPLTGNLTAYRTDFNDPLSLPITRGHLVRCRVKWAGGTYQLWTMRCKAPQIELDTGNLSVDLEDDLALLDAGGRDWWFRKTNRRPHGFTADEIAREVGRQLGVKVRKAAQGKTRMELKMKNATGLAVLKKAYANEKQASGLPYIIRMRNGELEIVGLAYNPTLYILSKQIQTALIAKKAGSKVPTTVLTGRARLGKGSKTQTITYTAHDARVVRALGYVHDTFDVGRVGSHKELRDKVKDELAKRLRMNDKISITHQGIPFIGRGDATYVDLPKEGYKGSQAIVFCTRASHTVQAGVYTSDFDFNATDPVVSALAAAKKAAAKRAATSAARGRALGGGTGNWITVTATFFGVADSGGPPACGGDFNYNGGFLYAELGFSGGAGSKLGPLFGMAQLPCGFALEIQVPSTGRSAVARKHDTGGGAPGARLDMWHILADYLGFTSIGLGSVLIRRA